MQTRIIYHGLNPTVPGMHKHRIKNTISSPAVSTESSITVFCNTSVGVYSLLFLLILIHRFCCNVFPAIGIFFLTQSL